MREKLKECEAEIAREESHGEKRKGLPCVGLRKIQQAWMWLFLLGANCRDFPSSLRSDASWYH